jgi:hypothetical protein
VTAPPSAADVSTFARQHTEAAVAAPVEALSVPTERVQAAIALLNVGWGAPVQPLALDANNLVAEFRDGLPSARAANGEDADGRHHIANPMV